MKQIHFRVTGGKKLKGTVDVDTSKNGAMGVFAAALLNTAPTTIHHVPNIEEVHRVLEVFASIGIDIAWRGTTLTLTPPQRYTLASLDEEAARKTRTIIMCLKSPVLNLF